jgi:hypothetical protein
VADHKNATVSGTVEYKALFIGACVLLSILGPAAIGYVITDINDTNRAQWQRLKELYEKLADLQGAASSHNAEHTNFRSDIDDQEFRIRVLEHQGERR